jgi:hypothetical protein
MTTYPPRRYNAYTVRQTGPVESAPNEETQSMPQFYVVKVVGALTDSWSDWFSDMEIQVHRTTHGPTMTTLTGPVADQARLRGIVSKLWDLNLTIVSINRGSPENSDLDGKSGGEQW